MQRPWQGAQEDAYVPDLPAYDAKCYLCPGNERASGDRNEKYTSTFVFENDYAALKPLEVAPPPAAPSALHADLFRSEPARGRCYVMCFNPAHNLTLAQLSSPPYSAASHIVPIVEAWQALYQRIARENPFVRYIQLFENKGSAMGCSNPHPHCQVWSLDYIPVEPAKTLESLRKFALDPRHADAAGPRDARGRPSLLLEYARLELASEGRPRVVALNDDFLAVVPYWAVWPFEVLVLPHRRCIPSIAELSAEETRSFAGILGEVTCRYDDLFKTSFPYSMGLHQRPVPQGSPADRGEDEVAEFAVLHVHFYPPLLRSATVRKFLVGYVAQMRPRVWLTFPVSK